MSENIRDLVEDLATVSADGSAALVLVDDYLERAKLLESFTEEASLYGILAITLGTPEEAQRQLPTADRSGGRAALVPVDAGEAQHWAPWLEATREALPQWVRFLVVLMMPEDVSILARLAPAFMSWAKGLEFRKLDIPGPIPAEDVEGELARMTAETGLSPKAFVEAWKCGEVPDTFRNTTWLNLAWAASRRDAP
jgi:hypothetical protein